MGQDEFSSHAIRILALTDAIARAGPVPLMGSYWPRPQPMRRAKTSQSSFFVLSALNHAWEAIGHGNRTWQNLSCVNR